MKNLKMRVNVFCIPTMFSDKDIQFLMCQSIRFASYSIKYLLTLFFVDILFALFIYILVTPSNSIKWFSLKVHNLILRITDHYK